MNSTFNRIYCGDAIKIMSTFPDETFKLVITSPPYNLCLNKNKKNWRKGAWANAALYEGYDVHDDCMDDDEYNEWQRNCLAEMYRLIKQDGAIFYNHKWKSKNKVLNYRHEIVKDLPIRQILIWHRSGDFNFNNYFFSPNYEVIYVIAKPDFKLLPKATGLGSVWKIDQERNNDHPAPFPIDLPTRIIESVGEGPVLDPFIGSGTTAIAANYANLKWVGIDNSRKYIKMAEKRIAQYQFKKLDI